MASVASSEPPDPAPLNIPAVALNPVWASAAAGGHSHNVGRAARIGNSNNSRAARGATATRAGGSNNSDTVDDSQVLGPISLLELEHRHRVHADGAESSLFSDDEGDQEGDAIKGSRHTTTTTTKRHRHNQSSNLCNEEDEYEGTKRQKRVTIADATASAISAAAFGGGATIDESVDDDSEIESSSLTGGELVPFRRTFPVRGVSCIGCSAEREIVSKVDEFVKKNSSKMNEDALYRTASVFWRPTVVDPAKREGVAIAEWPWKDLRSHYRLHVCDPYIQRMDCCRQLSAVRKMLELSLVRTDGDQRVVDHKNTDLLLKVIGMQSKELSLLNGNAMPPPPNRPPNRPPPEVAAK
jgi:hypothetical protein